MVAQKALERAEDSWELLSGGNWIPTCCSLGSLMIKRKEIGQQRRDGKEGKRKPLCVMYGQCAKVSVSFINPRARPTLG